MDRWEEGRELPELTPDKEIGDSEVDKRKRIHIRPVGASCSDEGHAMETETCYPSVHSGGSVDQPCRTSSFSDRRSIIEKMDEEDARHALEVMRRIDRDEATLVSFEDVFSKFGAGNLLNAP
uniref:Uncharacterized protein n=1 Tax=Candidatus Kentrum sp. SD TaxID=2126332 RepID=A0A450Z1P8_9GAMM|nr:MAG: hypothetical protein BECKSD772F_GA0070984_11062 [Candidatus Kentron sp. SD]VFK47726.1 MAG: hypothetical protein BECKSD772E_GA0070983_11042 [Candidatus Kentron sp. SD]VFK80337.1 MAG: hypothetical protein BECKSD772D_GA0070982_11043 [Candidatus Kentron sp. SD]